MIISWLGTATVVLEACGKKIIFDPYDREWNRSLPALTSDQIADADAICITHPHIDHFSNLG